ncbi:hypothetical protein P168DRAFT_278909 [Aspergillus campestris IBT 28561]|uniref:Zn(2)-C6 fungal-type domain-containing protein n=1 Tax=Aspergillus campestris (strain IBT 28561) TaxID=1392248 RepID=A0A2I1DHS8_ASPC2|nr:uncharacterized protein P168DRAFT_278909 [Aspergillus campestris IBT 28561]PKY09427.1 hypothetical protein P168DRAFT_278909 [Aspergillus campestris IBT 28561]
MNPDSFHHGITKRIRQACASCRKTKCSGEKPVCFHCRRNRKRCVYEPYSATVTTTDYNPPPPPMSTISDDVGLLQLPYQSDAHGPCQGGLLQRISMIESRLAELSGQPVQQQWPASSQTDFDDAHILPSMGRGSSLQATPPQSTTFCKDPFSFPPPPVMRSVIDTYFIHVHNQPYSYFQESSFREKMKNHELPRCLVLAVLASAVRFSSHNFYAGKIHEAVDTYARESWLLVLTDHLTVENNLDIAVVQTVNMLAVIDYTAGRARSGWLKIGIAARISQDLRLMTEPDHPSISVTEQEERRRTFWSAYLVDKLISGWQSRPLAIHDEDCHVQLPCDEQTFQAGMGKKTQTLSQLSCWDSNLADSPSPFALVILMASIFGRCTRYVHRQWSADKVPPWDTKSEFSAINSSLLLLESYSKLGTTSIAEAAGQDDDPANPQKMGHFIFAHTMFHLCHCLLNHPFIVHLRLKPFGSKIPHSFPARALHAGYDHSRQLLDLLHNAIGSGCLIESSFYPYCIVVAAGIQSLACHVEPPGPTDPSAATALQYVHRALELLEGMGRLWAHAANMATRLREFHSQSHLLSSLLDPTRITADLDRASADSFRTLIDYGAVGAALNPGTRVSGADVSPSAASWSPNILAPADAFDSSTQGFPGISPSMQLPAMDNIFSWDTHG